MTKNERVGTDLPAHQEEITDLTLTPDKKLLITGDRIGQVKIWDMANRQEVKSFRAHLFRIVAFAMSPDGSRFVTAGDDNLVKLWETSSGKELRRWDFHVPPQGRKSFIRNLTFAPDGKHVATANANATVYLLELP